MLAHNNWNRPVYFAITVGNDHYMNLEDYFQLEGLAYRVTPIKRKSEEGTGWINVEKMYDNLVNKFQWGNMEKEGVYMGEQVQRMSTNYRSNFARLAKLLAQQGDTLRAIKTLDRCMEVMPPNKIQVDYFCVHLADAYYKAGNTEKANDPWGGHTLEWSTDSPPPTGNFSDVPVVDNERPLLFPAATGGDDQ